MINLSKMSIFIIIFISFCICSCGLQYKNDDGSINEQKIEEAYDLITIDFANAVVPTMTKILDERLANGEITSLQYEKAIAVMNVFTSQERAIKSAEVVNASFADIIRTFASWFNLFNRTVLPLLADVLEVAYPEKVIIIQSLETILKSTGYLL